ncbi:MAG: HD domain-containing protein [Candidatus Marinimicrobia bacterium]|mgnify:FL=1|jgi:HD-GYP domain-containing protein (c-di-GMP phosphodiesterase class II)|nr:HD domain-containing protein [Anaerolineae bacterium]MBT7686134.1 HD domain-containing protein [Candidatus Neomarinimicrobiota bacterium]
MSIFPFSPEAEQHDIGKMSIPDATLKKEGSFSKEEWKIMRQHPQNAYDMLSSIPYLEQALDIPYCHHEKWDGSGYPRGLKGEDIPLSARMFSVVDVWDALCSDRPYRLAWEEDKVIDYIRKRAGVEFDPKVVDAFLKLVCKQE